MDPDDRPCSVDGCSDTKIKAKGLCPKHYRHQRKWGSPTAPTPPRKTRRKTGHCPVSGCEKEILRGEYCYAHYMKNYRYGTPTPAHTPPAHEDLAGKKFGLLTVVEWMGAGDWRCVCDCGQETTSRGWNLKAGQKASCGSKMHVRKDDVTYTAPHARCFWRWGSAKQYDCVQCGAPAAHWAYDHSDPDERMALMAPGGREMPISLWEEFYQPMCASCHKRLDLAVIRQGRK